MSENTTTGGLVEELRALHVRGVEYSCRGCGQDWPCDTTSLLDAHASRTAEATCSHTWPCPVHSPASSSPEPGAVEAPRRPPRPPRPPGGPACNCAHYDSPALCPVHRPEQALMELLSDIDKRPGTGTYFVVARAILDSDWLREHDERVVAAAKAEALLDHFHEYLQRSGERAEFMRSMMEKAWDESARYYRTKGPYPEANNPHRTAGPERRTEPDEAVSGD